MTIRLNDDLARFVAIDTEEMPWQPSPSPTVWRKRLYALGAPEQARVTSVVRYDAGARFPAHDHPDGEEILVLAGTFSDEHGHFPAGSYLLNPEGFRHAPFSVDGCLIFVRLRQHGGDGRAHVVHDTAALAWGRTNDSEIVRKDLFRQPGFADVTCIERWSSGAQASPRAAVTELFVIEGMLAHGPHRYGPGFWIRLPADGGALRADTDCVLFVREGVGERRPV